MLALPFDPIERAKEVEEVVVKNGKRKYYRFRHTSLNILLMPFQFLD